MTDDIPAPAASSSPLIDAGVCDVELRDYFAAAALQGLAANAAASLPVSRLAQIAYELANAMLDRRRVEP